MKHFRFVLFVCSFACAVAQPPATGSPQSKPAPAPAQQPSDSESHIIPIPVPGPHVAPDKVVLTIGDLNLTAHQFEAIAEMLPEASKIFVLGPGRQKFADQIAKVMILAEEARRRKLDDSPDVHLQSFYRTNEWLSTLAENAIRDSIKIDDAEVRDYYDAHKPEFERVRARHILIRMEGSPAPLRPGAKDLTDDEALAKAKDIVARARGGEDFATIAMAESDDTVTAAKGGDLGTFARGQMLPSVEEAAFTLEPGKISDPIHSQYGYHIIKVETREFKTLEEVRPTIEKKLLPKATQKAIDAIEKAVKIEMDPEYFGTAPTPGTQK